MMKNTAARRRWTLISAAGSLLLLAGTAQAQTMYRCKVGSTVQLSDKPCAASLDSRIGYYGPTQQAQPMIGNRPLPQQNRAPDHLGYLSQQCDEQLRILLDRRKRLAAASEGEQADFKRFESNFTQRCRNG